MLKKFLKDVVVFIVGKNAEKIVDLIDSKKYVNEFIIAKKLEITINQTRNILYKLSDYGLVSSIRKKDKKKGWYTYFWKIENLKSLEFLKGILEKRINQLSNQIRTRESKQFYVCNTCNIEFNEENALLYDFTCNECGGIFSMKDNTKVLREFSKNRNKFQNELEFVEKEIQKEKEKIEKKKQKDLRKEYLEKERLKAEKRAARKKLVKKKIVKKKITKKKLIKKKLVKKKKVVKKKSVKKKAVKKKIVKKKVEKKRLKKLVKKINKKK